MKLEQSIADRYSIHERIGQGGMGTVYRGLDKKNKKPVAVKHLKSDVVRGNPENLKRFQREGDLLRELNHPNIVHLIDFVEEDDQHFIVLEYVGGGSLADLLRDKSLLSVNQVLQIALDLSDALTRAHHLNIIHRDIKPSNILMSSDGRPLLSDFGIAHANNTEQITQTGAVIGTSAYLPPEALAGHPPDEKADVWAFGVLIYQMLTGHTPYNAKQSLAELFASILNDPVPEITQYREDVPIALVQLLHAMLEKDPKKRIGSTRQIGATIESIMTGTPPTALVRAVDDLDVTMTIDSHTPTDSSINLPTPSTPFVGRDDERDEIGAKITSPDIRLLTLVGAGGMGKTRLAIQTAKDNASHFAGGVHFVELAPVDNVDLVVSAIASSVGYAFFGDDSPLNQLTAFLRDKEMLLVMDNFEHLTSGASVVSDILAAAPQVKVLVTSRERLNLQGESLHAVTGMQFPDTDTATDIDGYSAIKLFLQGATRVQPDFSLSEHLPDILRIINLVDGTPLGIELATAWLRLLPPSEIADEIESSFDFLESTLRNVPERHRSIRAVFEYSWELMTDDERAALARLSIFAGSFTRDAACNVADTSLRILSMLVDKSLLSVSRTGRYTMHTLVKTYADEKLRAVEGETQRLRRNHVVYYAGRMAQIFPVEGVAEEHQLDLQLLALDIDNIRAMWHWAVDMNMFAELRSMFRMMWMFYEMQGLVTEALEMLSYAMDKLNVQSPSQERDHALIVVLAGRAWNMQRAGKYQLAVETAQKAVALGRQSDDVEALAFALSAEGYIQQYVNDFEAGMRLSQEASQLFESINSYWGKALSVGTMGYISFILGDYDTAERYMTEGVELSKYMGNLFGQAYSASNLGELCLQCGDFERAKALFEGANHKFEKLGYRWGQALTLNNLGKLARLQYKPHEAHQFYSKALAIYQELGNTWGIAQTLTQLGRVSNNCMRCDEASHYLQEALRLHRDLNNASGIITTLTYLGYAAIGVQDFDTATQYLEEALKLAASSNAEPRVLDVVAGYAAMWASNGETERALEALSLVIHHHATDHEARAAAQEQLEVYRGELVDWLYDEAILRGKNAQLRDTVSALAKA